jgi:alpha-tubulin suppressor-like RCC1 family protein
MRNQSYPRRIEALQGVRIRSASAGQYHAIALSEDGLMYSWGNDDNTPFWGFPHVEKGLLPKPVEALRGVRMGSASATGNRTFAVTDTGEAWGWGCDGAPPWPFGPGGQPGHMFWPGPLPVEDMKGIQVDGVVGVNNDAHTCWCWQITPVVPSPPQASTANNMASSSILVFARRRKGCGGVVHPKHFMYTAASR